MAARAPSRQDRALWREAMRGVKPLAGSALPPEAPAPPAADRIADQARSPATPRERLPVRPPAPLPELALDRTPGLDRRSAERLKRGQLAIEARLDLHGRTQAEAHRALNRFLARAQAEGRRCVLVITGKGLRRPAQPGEPLEEGMAGAAAGDIASGVLKAAVPRWLNEPENRARLLAFTPAQPRDGGGGALYLLLRRER
jgi:DNA-nicking Smr family endonuclease